MKQSNRLIPLNGVLWAEPLQDDVRWSIKLKLQFETAEKQEIPIPFRHCQVHVNIPPAISNITFYKLELVYSSPLIGDMMEKGLFYPSSAATKKVLQNGPFWLTLKGKTFSTISAPNYVNDAFIHIFLQPATNPHPITAVSIFPPHSFTKKTVNTWWL